MGAIFFNFAQGAKDVEKGLRGTCGNEVRVTGLRENTIAVEALNKSDDLVGPSDVTRRRDDMHLFSDVVGNISRAKSEKIESAAAGRSELSSDKNDVDISHFSKYPVFYLLPHIIK